MKIKLLFTFVIALLGCSYFVEAAKTVIMTEGSFVEDGRTINYTTYKKGRIVWTSFRHSPQPCFCNMCKFTKISGLSIDEKLNYDIQIDENLIISVNHDANIEIYELISWKCVESIFAKKNEKITLDNIENNKHYIVLFDIIEGIYERQIFFINNNLLYIGGK